MKDNTKLNERKNKGGAIVKPRESIKEFFGGFSSVRTKRALAALFAFAVALIVAGTSVFPGTYPLGIAAVSAFSGITVTAASLVGALLGAVRIPTVSGVYAAVYMVLALARTITALYLSSDKLPDKRNKNETFSALRKFFSDIIRRKSTAESSQELISMLSRHSGIMLRESIAIRIALSSCAALFAGAWSVVEGGYSYYDLVGAVFSLLFTPVATYIFYICFESKNRYSPIREFALCASLAFFTMSFSSISAPTSLSSPRFDVGCVFALVISLVFSTQYGVHRGAIASLACGLVLEPIYAPMYALAAVVCGAVSSVSSGSFSRIAGVVSGGIVCSVWAIYTSGIDGFVDVFPPVVAACALISPLAAYDLIKLPQTLFGGGLAALDSARRASSTVEKVSLAEIKGKISRAADGLYSVSAVLSGMGERLSKPSPAEASEIVEETFETYCLSCRIREKCRHDGHTVERLKDKMTRQLMKDGVVSASAVPSYLASHCYNMGRILDDINLSFGQKVERMKEGDKLSQAASDYLLAGDLISAVKRSAAEESEVDEELSKKLRRILSYNDFHATSVTVWGKRMKNIFVGDIDLSSTRMGGDDIRKMFERIVGERLSAPEFELDGSSLSMKMHTVRSFSCVSGMFSCAASSVQRYCCDKHGCGADSDENELGTETRIDVSDSAPEDICGDVITAFEVGEKQYMIISDGMGSGREAALTSGVVVSLLERLIRSGAELETSLKMLNAIIRACGRECSATVDIAEIDCVSGEARFIKSGAAPSFVIRDGSIFRLQSKTVPIGIIRALDAEMIKFDIEAGDTVVMISDGAARSYDEAPWLLDLMTADETVLRGDERTAAITIVSEAAIRGSADDITAGILRVRGIDAG